MYICFVRKTKKQTEKTIDDLLDSAISLFIKNGYSAVTLEQIAMKIGMTRGAFYHHFHSKEDILNALIARERNSFENKLADLFIEKREPDEHLHTILYHIISNFFDNRRFNRFIHFTWFKIESSIIENKFFYQGATNEILINELSMIIKRGQKKGLFSKNVPSIILALEITSSILGIYRLHFQCKKEMTKENAKLIIENFIKSITIK
jgi:AcrR family transcriptional regulator